MSRRIIEDRFPVDFNNFAKQIVKFSKKIVITKNTSDMYIDTEAESMSYLCDVFQTMYFKDFK